MLFVRGARRLESGEARPPHAGAKVVIDRHEAATVIQSVWRGRQDRVDCEKRRNRQKPLGYHTHTLGLTYISATREAKASSVSARRRLYLLLEEPGSSQAAQALSIAIISAIALSILVFVLETVPEIYEWSPELWFGVEVFCTTAFTAEYCCRLATCDQAGITRRVFVLSPLNLLDLLAVLPFFIELVLKWCGFRDASELRAFRVVRLIRITRVVKLGRYADGVRLMAKALVASSQAISVLVFMLCMGVVLFSSALYHVERLSCPEREDMSEADLQNYEEDCADLYYRGVSPRFGLCCTEDGAPNDFPSIVAASWWSMVTMTSVGYGDIYPKTTLGKCVGFVVMLVGMVVIALPVAIVGQKFQDVYETHHMEMARFSGAARMKVPGEEWSLVPASDICSKLRNLKLKDSTLAGSVVHLASNLEAVWEQRELLMRERREELDLQEQVHEKVNRLLSGMQGSLSASPF